MQQMDTNGGIVGLLWVNTGEPESGFILADSVGHPGCHKQLLFGDGWNPTHGDGDVGKCS